MTELLLDTPLTAEQQGYTEIIRGSGEALLCIINDILDFSKIEAGGLELEHVPFNLHAVLEDVLELLATKAAEKKLDLQLLYAPDMPREFTGDPGRIRQVMLNLVSNAIKFTDSGHVLVEAERKATASAGVRITVHDTGIGIPQDRRDMIFQKFRQLDSSTTRKYGGTGLGLSISRQLVEMMGGAMLLTSEVGKGSSFALDIPLRVNTATMSAPRASGMEGLRLLVVDERRAHPRVPTRLCAQWGMRVEEAHTVEDALRMIAAANAGGDPYQAICLDEAAMGTDCIEAARQFGEPWRGVAPGIILITDHDRRSIIPTEDGIRCDACITKPIREAALRNSLEGLLVHRESGLSNAGLPANPVLPASRSVDIPHLAGRRVLLVEDNLVNQQLGSTLIAKTGSTVDCAANGLEALHMAAQLPYDLIFMDCQMPEMDGFEATREIRIREAQGRRTPIIALTAEAMEGDRERCLQAGMDDYLSKPVRATQLWDMLAKYLPPKAN
jgi:CheY-like chemotaxis protein